MLVNWPNLKAVSYRHDLKIFCTLRGVHADVHFNPSSNSMVEEEVIFDGVWLKSHGTMNDVLEGDVPEELAALIIERRYDGFFMLYQAWGPTMTSIWWRKEGCRRVRRR